MVIHNKDSRSSIRYDLNGTPKNFNKLKIIHVEVEYFEIDGQMTKGVILTDKLETVDLKIIEISNQLEQYSDLSCLPLQKQSQLKRASFSIQSSQFKILLLQFEQQNPNHVIAISQLRILANCMINCLTCNSQNICEQCIYGFQLVEIDNNKVCEQVGNCQVGNCQLCAGENLNKCTRCNAGYKLENNTCTKEDGCPDNEYYEQRYRMCLPFSKNCYFYSSSIGKYQKCPQNIIPLELKCPFETLILGSDIIQSNQFICGCVIDSCTRCSLSECIECEKGYSLDDNKICKKNLAPNYYFNKETEQQQQCPDYKQCQQDNCCQQCSEDKDNLKQFSKIENKCISLKCPEFKKFNADLKECLCEVNNCQICDTQTCNKCLLGYQYDSDKKICDKRLCTGPNQVYSKEDEMCVTCPNNCLDCTSSKCFSCKEGFKVSGSQSCKRICGKNCDECDDNQICKSCQGRTYQIQNDKINCYMCQQNCLKCNENECQQCSEETYKYPSDKTKCMNCPTNCKDCDEKKCNQCREKYYLTDDKQSCVRCEENCNECNKNQCLKCIKDFYPNKYNPKQCIQRRENCKKHVQDSATCQECIQGYKQEQGDDQTCQKIICEDQKCELCNETECFQCQDKYFVDINDKKKCVQCDINCVSDMCDSKDKKCKECSSGYYPDYINCYSCGQNCDKCDGQKCHTCKEGYFIDLQNEKNCISCDETCQECDQKTLECQICKDGYKFGFGTNNDRQKCIPCHKTCKKCNDEKCLECNNYKTYPSLLNPQECKKCHENCSECNNIQKNTECKTCKEGYYHSDEDKEICLPCQKGCKRCVKDQCLECINDKYTRSQINPAECVECGSQQKNCQRCNFDGSVCKKCERGSNEGHLSYCECHSTCDLCDGRNLCQKCKNPLDQVDYFDSTKCVSCQKGCKKCTKEECIECINHEHIIDPQNKTQCRSCQDDNCERCNPQNAQDCLLCKIGYTKNKETKLCDVFVCRVDNCQFCTDRDEKQCKDCLSGYHLDENKQCTQIDEFNRNDFQIKILSVTPQEGYVVSLQFNRPISFYEDKKNLKNTNIKKYFHFHLSSTQMSQYSIWIQSYNENEINFGILPTTNVKNQDISITIIDHGFLQENSLLQEQKNQPLYPFFVITPQNQLDASQSVSEVGNNVSMAAVFSVIPVAIFSNFYLLINTIDHTSFFYFLMFTDIRYPKNVVQFYGMFKNFQFPFIPNIFQDYIVDPDYVQETPKVFMNQNADAYFLKNAGQALTICIGVIALLIFVRIVSFLPIPRLQKYLKQGFCNYWIMSAFLDLFFCEYLYLLIGSFLQVYCYDISDQGSSIINYVTFGIVTIILIVVPFLLLRLMYIQPDEGVTKEFTDRYQTIVCCLHVPLKSTQNNIQTIPQFNQLNHQNNKQKSINYITSQKNIQDDQSNSNNNKKDFPRSVSHLNQDEISSRQSNQQGHTRQNSQLSPIQLIIVPSESSIQIESNHNNQNSQSQDFNVDNTSIYRNQQKKNGQGKDGSSENNEGNIFSGLFGSQSISIKSLKEKINNQNQINQRQQLYSKYYFPILYLRKLLFLVIICFIYFDPFVQLCLISCLNLFIVWFLISIQPFVNKFDNYKSAFWELILIGVQVCSAFLISDYDNQDESDRFNLGWIIISLTSVLIVVETAILVLSLTRPLYSHAAKFIKKAFFNQKNFIEQQKLNNLQTSIQIMQQNAQQYEQNRQDANINQNLQTQSSPLQPVGTQGQIITENHDLIESSQKRPKSQKRIKSIFIIQKLDDIQNPENQQQIVDNENKNNQRINNAQNKSLQIDSNAFYEQKNKSKQQSHNSLILIKNNIQRESIRKDPRNREGTYSSEQFDNVSDLSNCYQKFGNSPEKQKIPYFQTSSLSDINNINKEGNENQEGQTMNNLSLDDQSENDSPVQKKMISNIFTSVQGLKSRQEMLSNESIGEN